MSCGGRQGRVDNVEFDIQRPNTVIIKHTLTHHQLFYSVAGYFSPGDTLLTTAPTTPPPPPPQLPFTCPCVVWLLKKKKKREKSSPQKKLYRKIIPDTFACRALNLYKVIKFLKFFAMSTSPPSTVKPNHL